MSYHSGFGAATEAIIASKPSPFHSAQGSRAAKTNGLRYTHPARMVVQKKTTLSWHLLRLVPSLYVQYDSSILANIYNSYSSSSASTKVNTTHSHTTTLLHHGTVVCSYHASAGSVGREPPTSDNFQPLLVEAVRFMLPAVVLESTPDYDT